MLTRACVVQQCAAPAADPGPPRRPSHSWPVTWPDPSRGPAPAQYTAAAPAPPEDHHTSGDSIPVGFEASHLNVTADSGLAGSVHSVVPGQSHAPSVATSQQDGAFFPGPESTFIPVEPAKESVVSPAQYLPLFPCTAAAPAPVLHPN